MSRITKNAIILMVQDICSAIISIFVTGYIARKLGTGDYGVFSFSLAFVLLFAEFASIGLRPLTIRELAKDLAGAKAYFDRIFSIRLILTLGAILLIVILVNILNYPKKSIFIVYIATTGFLFDSTSSILKDFFQGFERMEFIAFSNFIVRVFVAAFSVIFLYMGYRLIAVSAIYAVGQFIGLLIVFILLYVYFALPKPKMDLKFVSNQLKLGLPFAATGFFIGLNQRIDVTILSRISGDSAVGLYSASQNLIRSLGFISSISSAAYPTFARTYSASKAEVSKIFEKYFSYLLLISLPMATGIILIADRIIFLIYGTTYADSALILQIIACSLPFMLLTVYQRYFLGAIGMQIIVMVLTVATVIINIILNIILIPRYQGIGAALAAVVSAFLGFVFFTSVASRQLTKSVEPQKCVKILIANLIMGIFIFFLPWKNLPIIMLSSVFVYTLALVLTGILKKQDFLGFKRLFKSKNTN